MCVSELHPSIVACRQNYKNLNNSITGSNGVNSANTRPIVVKRNMMASSGYCHLRVFCMLEAPMNGTYPEGTTAVAPGLLVCWSTS